MLNPEILPQLSNIIFDLGGVLYELDFELFLTSLTNLQAYDRQNPIKYSFQYQPQVFDLYETGKITTAQFRDRLRQDFNITAADAQIDTAWNSILVGLWRDRLELLQQLKQRYRICLLSNINDLHLNAVEGECKQLFALFEKCFFSHWLGMHKPQPEVFNHVLTAMEFSPEQTLYIDDSPRHVVAANNLGINAIHLQNSNDLPAICAHLLAK